MILKRVLLGVALAAAITIGFLAAPTGEPARASERFQCAVVSRFEGGGVVFVLDNIRFEVALSLLASGTACVPQAAADASPRFNCTIGTSSFPNSSIAVVAGVLRVGGQCLPAGVPPTLPGGLPI